MESLNELINALKRFPSVGKKSARRIAYYLLRQDDEYLSALGSLVADLKKNLYTCSHCGNISSSDPCNICSDPLRDRKTLCIVDDVEAISVFEENGVYNGIYHVLGKVSPLDGEDLSDEAAESLHNHIHELGADEVIIATNPSIEGDMAYYTLLDVLKDAKVRNVTRLAYGLPVGGSIEFADRVTLNTALTSRTKVL